MHVVVVPIELYPLEPIFGGWCDRCALPSVVTIPVLFVNPATLRVFGRREFTQCVDCAQR